MPFRSLRMSMMRLYSARVTSMRLAAVRGSLRAFGIRREDRFLLFATVVGVSCVKASQPGLRIVHRRPSRIKTYRRN